MKFNSTEILERVKEKIQNLHLPIPPQPSTEDVEMQLPEDPDKLTSTQLAQKMSRASSWFGYVQRLLGVLESELILVEAEYKIEIGVLGIVVRDKLGKVSKDVVEANVLDMTPELMPLFTRIHELKAIKATLESRLEIYSKFHQTLSREQSRREMEMKTG